MNKNLLTIQKAAHFLGVSTKTLRRWESAGKLVPIRTIGNQRRYTLEQLTDYRLQIKDKKNLEFIIHNSEFKGDDLGFRTHEFSNQQSIISNQKSEPQAIQGLDSFSYLKLEIAGISSAKKRILGSFLVAFSLLVFAVSTKTAVEGLNTKLKGFQTGEVAQVQNANPQAVLGASTEGTNYVFRVNVPSSFSQSADFLSGITIQGKSVIIGGIDTQNGDISAGTGKITASNVVYGLTAGTGLSVSGGQNPTLTNTGVTSLGGSSGSIDLTGGTGITIDGLKVSNSDLGSSQNIFKNVVVGSSTITAGSNTDTLNISAGSGVTLTSNTSTKTITISSSGGSGVTSLNTQTGALTLAAGTGLSLTGLTFTNAGVTSVQGVSGAVSLAAGSNVSLSTDTNTKTVTISSTVPSSTITSTSGWTQSGNYVTLTNSGNYVGIGTTTPSSALQVGGDILPTQNSVYNLGSSGLSWNNIYANQIVGTGAQINLTIPATSSATGLSVSMTGTGSGQLASFSFNGTQVLGVGTNDVYVGGKISMTTDDTNLANAKDIFVYDTTKDSDTGQWINNDTAQSASWYNETVNNTGLQCSLTSDTRCGQRPFPQKVTIYVTSNTIFIYDNKDNTLWMKFKEGTGYSINGTSVTLTSVYALNGIVYIGTDKNGLLEINFLTDKIYQFDYNGGAGGRAQFLGTIADRNSNKGYGARESWGQIASDQVNGVYAKIINGKIYIAVSTLGGASVINLSDQKVVKYVDN